MTALPENNYRSKDITTSLSESVTVLQKAEHQIRLLRRDRNQLLGALKDVLETCPCDADTTPQFLTACLSAAQLISKLWES